MNCSLKGRAGHIPVLTVCRTDLSKPSKGICWEGFVTVHYRTFTFKIQAGNGFAAFTSPESEKTDDDEKLSCLLAENKEITKRDG